MSNRLGSLLALALACGPVSRDSPLGQFFQAVVQATGSATAPLANFLVVDGASTAAEQAGTFAAPYKTIGAAMAAVTVPNTTVFVLPGAYAENVVFPAAVNGTSLVGTSPANTAIEGTDTSVALTIAPTSAGVLAVAVRNITVRGHGVGSVGVLVSGAAMPHPVAGLTGVLLENVVAETIGGDDALAIVSVQGFQARGCTTNDSFTVRQAGTGLILGHRGDALTIGYDATDAALPAIGRADVNLSASSFSGALTISDQASVIADSSVSVVSLLTGSEGVAGGLAPRIVFHGQQGERGLPGDLNLSLPTSAVTSSQLDLSGARSYATTPTITSAGGSPSFNVRDVDLHGPLTLIGGSGAMAVDFRGGQSTASPPYVVTGAHTVDRSRVVVRGLAIPAAAGGTVFTFGAGDLAAEPPFPAGATYGAELTLRALVAAAADVPAVLAESATALTIASTGGATVDLVLVRSLPDPDPRGPP